MVTQKEGEIRRRHERIEDRLKQRAREGESWLQAKREYDQLIEELREIPFGNRVQITEVLLEPWESEDDNRLETPDYLTFMENLDIETAADIADLNPGQYESDSLLIVVEDVRGAMSRLWG